MSKQILNEAQQKIVDHNEGACLVIASAGSGKSFSLIKRVENLIKNYGVSESEITIITFTKNSAEDLVAKLKSANINNVRVGTFHSVCSRILVDMGIISFNGKTLKEYEVDNLWTAMNNGDKTDCMEIRSFISYQKAYNVRPNDKFVYMETDYPTNFLRKCYVAYEQYKQDNKVFDFDDILLMTLDLFNKYEGTNVMDKYKTRYLLVDEAQDNNSVQNMLMGHLCSTTNVMCIGDARQSLYSFRGSNPQEFLGFRFNFPNAKIIDMSTNYRSCSNIIERVNIFAKNWYKGELFPPTIPHIQERGTIVRKTVANEEREAEYVVENVERLLSSGIDPNTIAIIYRLNETSSMIEMKLKEKGIKYTIDNNSSIFKIREISAILCVLRLACNDADNIAYEEVFNSRMGGFKFMPNSILNLIRQNSSKYGYTFLKTSENLTGVTSYQNKKLIEFSIMINKINKMIRDGQSLATIIDKIVSVMKIEECIEDNQKYDRDKKEARKGCIKAVKKFTKRLDVDTFLSMAYGNNKDKKKNNDSNRSVNLMTVHKSKGLEWENVFFVGNGASFPSPYAEIDDEANVFYVGVTRAKRNLWVTEVGEGSIFVSQFCS